MNATFNKFLQQIFQDVDGAFSSKRVVAFIATAVLVAAFIADVGFGRVVQQFIFEGFLYLDLGALGIAATEMFANRKTTTVTETKADIDVTKTVVDDTDKMPAAEE
jgi:hypothetical protein